MTEIDADARPVAWTIARLERAVAHRHAMGEPVTTLLTAIEDVLHKLRPLTADHEDEEPYDPPDVPELDGGTIDMFKDDVKIMLSREQDTAIVELQHIVRVQDDRIEALIRIAQENLNLLKTTIEQLHLLEGALNKVDAYLDGSATWGDND